MSHSERYHIGGRGGRGSRLQKRPNRYEVELDALLYAVDEYTNSFSNKIFSNEEISSSLEELKKDIDKAISRHFKRIKTNKDRQQVKAPEHNAGDEKEPENIIIPLKPNFEFSGDDALVVGDIRVSYFFQRGSTSYGKGFVCSKDTIDANLLWLKFPITRISVFVPRLHDIIGDLSYRSLTYNRENGIIYDGEGIFLQLKEQTRSHIDRLLQ